MLTRLVVRRFKTFEEVDIELGQRVVLIGPNNSGKSSALQALSLWYLGVKRWVEKKGKEVRSKKRTGVAINRRDMVNIPVSSVRMLWKDLKVQQAIPRGAKVVSERIPVEIVAFGEGDTGAWECGLEFEYANPEQIYCRPLLTGGEAFLIPESATRLQVAYLPPMSGLISQEVRLEPGAINVRIGEGRTAEVLRNLCYQVSIEKPEQWKHICERMKELFGVELEEPQHIVERGEIELYYRTRNGTRLEIQASGRGQQQTLLILAYLSAHPQSVLLIDEPDAHLEILRQRQIYNIITETAEQMGSQVIAASHSEVILNEAADRDVVIAFVGRPHRIDDRGNQLLKALKEIGFEDYYLAEQKGWVLYLEGSTDLAILRALARRLEHRAAKHLERPFVKYVGNQPRKAQEHFHGLREAKPDLVGIAIFDRLGRELPQDTYLQMFEWRRCEIENYLCTRETLLKYARALAEQTGNGGLFAEEWEQAMEDALQEVRNALQTLGKPDPFGGDLKVSEEFLPGVFRRFFEKLGREDFMRKTDYHVLADYVPEEEIAEDVREMLERISQVAERARPEGEEET
ncbi:Vitamin B12 import ATP-binding protein BtuD [bacterium HR14]|nr:Vitamin B12 import ATP-binding protein BtuD [bacterium HR14]